MLQERKEIRARFRVILHTCSNSSLNHLKDGDTERLQWKINKTSRDFEKLARELMEDSLTTAAKLLRN